MDENCECENCECADNGSREEKPREEDGSTEASAEQKVENMKKSIEDIGFKVEDTEEGIKITE